MVEAPVDPDTPPLAPAAPLVPTAAPDEAATACMRFDARLGFQVHGV